MLVPPHRVSQDRLILCLSSGSRPMTAMLSAADGGQWKSMMSAHTHVWRLCELWLREPGTVSRRHLRTAAWLRFMPNVRQFSARSCEWPIAVCNPSWSSP